MENDADLLTSAGNDNGEPSVRILLDSLASPSPLALPSLHGDPNWLAVVLGLRVSPRGNGREVAKVIGLEVHSAPRSTRLICLAISWSIDFRTCTMQSTPIIALATS